MAKNDILASMLVRITANSTQFLAEMAKANAGTAKFQSSVIAAGKSLVAGFGAYQVIGAIRSAIGVMADFEVQMSTVKAITGATGDQFKELEKNALDLGRSTRYTATQVGSLQVEFGRLGFSTKEIINATKATLNLATASGSDLARSAEIAGSTLRAFQIDAKDMSRVTDVMAAGFNTSALGMDNFAESIKYVSPVAKAVNVSLEETTAMLAVLADAGIKGSQAGTSLRRIFTQLTADGRPLAERMAELAAKGITLADANDEVGLYAQTALLVLGNQNDKVKELTETYKNANGETQRMADIMEDNLTGSVTKLSSAWEGLILSFKNSSGVIKQVTDQFTNLLTVLNSEKVSTLDKISAFLGMSNPQGVISVNLMANALNAAADAQSKANEEQQKYITESASVLLKDYGYDLVAITNALYDNKDAFAILAEVEKLHTQDVKSSAEAEAERLRGIQQSIDKMKQMEKQLYDLAEAEREARLARLGREISGTGVKGGVPSLISNVSPLSAEGFNPAVDEYGSAMISTQNAIAEAIQRANESQKEQIELVTQNRMAFASFADQVGNSLTQAIKAEVSFAQAFARVTASILDGIQARIVANIAEGSSKAFAKNPILGIAVVTAGFAIAKGLLGMIGKSSRSAGGGMSSGRVNNEVYGGGVSGLQNSTPNITGVIRGEDLWVVLQNYQRNNKYTSALG